MNYYKIEPDIPGRVEDARNLIDNRQSLDSITFIFDYWPNDLVESVPVFLASKKLARRIADGGITGFTLKKCRCVKGDQFHISCPGRSDMPDYFWLDVTGEAGFDDFGIENLNLVVSKKVLDILTDFDISLADISPFEPS